MAIAAAVKMSIAIELQFSKERDSATHPDYNITVECLMQARKSLGVENELPCAAKA